MSSNSLYSMSGAATVGPSSRRREQYSAGSNTSRGGGGGGGGGGSGSGSSMSRRRARRYKRRQQKAESAGPIERRTARGGGQSPSTGITGSHHQGSGAGSLTNQTQAQAELARLLREKQEAEERIHALQASLDGGAVGGGGGGGATASPFPGSHPDPVSVSSAGLIAEDIDNQDQLDVSVDTTSLPKKALTFGTEDRQERRQRRRPGSGGSRMSSSSSRKGRRNDSSFRSSRSPGMDSATRSSRNDLSRSFDSDMLSPVARDRLMFDEKQRQQRSHIDSQRARLKRKLNEYRSKPGQTAEDKKAVQLMLEVFNISKVLSTLTEAGWEARTRAMRRVRQLLEGFPPSPSKKNPEQTLGDFEEPPPKFPTETDRLSSRELMACLEPLAGAFLVQLGDLRSKVIIELTATIAHVARRLGEYFIPFAVLVPPLCRLTRNKQLVFSSAADRALEDIVSQAQTPNVLKGLLRSLNASQNADERANIAHYLRLVAAQWTRVSLHPVRSQMFEALMGLLTDAAEKVRDSARQLLVSWWKQFPVDCDAMYILLDSSQQAAVLAACPDFEFKNDRKAILEVIQDLRTVETKRRDSLGVSPDVIKKGWLFRPLPARDPVRTPSSAGSPARRRPRRSGGRGGGIGSGRRTRERVQSEVAPSSAAAQASGAAGADLAENISPERSLAGKPRSQRRNAAQSRDRSALRRAIQQDRKNAGQQEVKFEVIVPDDETAAAQRAAGAATEAMLINAQPNIGAQHAQHIEQKGSDNSIDTDALAQEFPPLESNNSSPAAMAALPASFIPPVSEPQPEAMDQKDEEAPIEVGTVVGSIEIGVSCRNVPKMDWLTESDPICVLYMRDEEDHTKFDAVAQTEWCKNQKNPDFTTTFVIQVLHGVDHVFRLSVYDVDEEQVVNPEDLIGHVTVRLSDLVTYAQRSAGQLSPPKAIDAPMAAGSLQQHSGSGPLSMRVVKGGKVVPQMSMLITAVYTAEGQDPVEVITDEDANIQQPSAVPPGDNLAEDIGAEVQQSDLETESDIDANEAAREPRVIEFDMARSDSEDSDDSVGPPRTSRKSSRAQTPPDSARARRAAARAAAKADRSRTQQRRKRNQRRKAKDDQRSLGQMQVDENSEPLDHDIENVAFEALASPSRIPRPRRGSAQSAKRAFASTSKAAAAFPDTFVQSSRFGGQSPGGVLVVAGSASRSGANTPPEIAGKGQHDVVGSAVYRALQLELKRSRAQVANLQEKVRAFELSDQNEMISSLRKKLRQSEANLKAANSRCESLAEHNQGLSKRIAGMRLGTEQRLATREQKLLRTKEREFQEVLEDQKEKFETELDQLDAKLEALQLEKRGLVKTVTALQGKVRNQREEKAQIAQLEVSLKSVEQERNEALALVEELTPYRELAQQYEDDKKNFEQELSVGRNAVERVASLEDGYGALRQELALKEEELTVEQANARLATEAAIIEQQKKAAAEQEQIREKAKRRYAKLEARVTKLQKEARLKQDELDNAKSEALFLSKSVEEWKNKATDLEKQVAQKNNRMKRLQQQVIDLSRNSGRPSGSSPSAAPRAVGHGSRGSGGGGDGGAGGSDGSRGQQDANRSASHKRRPSNMSMSSSRQQATTRRQNASPKPVTSGGSQSGDRHVKSEVESQGRASPGPTPPPRRSRRGSLDSINSISTVATTATSRRSHRDGKKYASFEEYLQLGSASDMRRALHYLRAQGAGGAGTPYHELDQLISRRVALKEELLTTIANLNRMAKDPKRSQNDAAWMEKYQQARGHKRKLAAALKQVKTRLVSLWGTYMAKNGQAFNIRSGVFDGLARQFPGAPEYMGGRGASTSAKSGAAAAAAAAAGRRHDGGHDDRSSVFSSDSYQGGRSGHLTSRSSGSSRPSSRPGSRAQSSISNEPGSMPPPAPRAPQNDASSVVSGASTAIAPPGLGGGGGSDAGSLTGDDELDAIIQNIVTTGSSAGSVPGSMRVGGGGGGDGGGSEVAVPPPQAFSSSGNYSGRSWASNDFAASPNQVHRNASSGDGRSSSSSGTSKLTQDTLNLLSQLDN